MTDITIPAPRGAVASQATIVEQSRAVAEVQAAIFVAQQFPRDLDRATAEMRRVAGTLALANRAFYRVPNRGEGPSVHLARELARIWGNIDYGVRELSRDEAAGTSEMQAFAWDQQTNARSTRSFINPHKRMVKGKRVDLVDLTDVYLSNQNVGARAVREAIFNTLPVDFTEEAMRLCRETLEHGEGKPLPKRIEEMVAAFAANGIRVEQLERKLGRPSGQWTPGDVASMGVLFTSLQRGETTVEEEFEAAGVSAADLLTSAPDAEVQS